jgi:CheY-like chemotaxis protein
MCHQMQQRRSGAAHAENVTLARDLLFYQNMASAGRRSFTVLIAEDEDSLRLLAALTVKSKGFDVLAASTVEEALHYWERHSEEIILLFSDIVMPGDLTGFDLAKQIRAKKPNLPIIFCSGHNYGLVNESPELQQGVSFLPKPYKQVDLSTLITKALAANMLRIKTAAA